MFITMNKQIIFLITLVKFIPIVVRLICKVENMNDIKKLPEKIIYNWVFIKIKNL